MPARQISAHLGAPPVRSSAGLKRRDYVVAVVIVIVVIVVNTS
jgi:hypothetical protein